MMKNKIFEILDNLGLEYKNYKHIPVFSCNDAKGIDIPGKRVKSLFLRNKHASKYYMVVLEDKKRFDSNKFRHLVGENKISFASEQRMIDNIGVKPGHVSPFALVNNEQKNVMVVFDLDLKSCEIGFHPGQNDNTVVLQLDGVEKFLNFLEVEFKYLEL